MANEQAMVGLTAYKAFAAEERVDATIPGAW